MKKLKEYKVPTRSIQDAKALTKPRYKRKNFNGSLGQKAYLIGFRIGDLYINQTHKNSPTLRIGTNSTKTAQIELVEKIFKPYGHIWKSRPYFLKSKTTARTQKAVGGRQKAESGKSEGRSGGKGFRTSVSASAED